MQACGCSGSCTTRKQSHALQTGLVRHHNKALPTTTCKALQAPQTTPQPLAVLPGQLGSSWLPATSRSRKGSRAGVRVLL